MKLRRLEIRELAGIDDPFALVDLSAGLNVVLGPNGSGKSSVCRAVRATLWPESHAAHAVHVASLWERAGEHWRAEARAQVSWQREGAESPPPPLPEAHLARCYTLALRDLLELDEKGGESLARELQVQLAGGYDLRALARWGGLKARHGRAEAQQLRVAERERHALETARRDLAREEDDLARLRSDAEAARAARDEVAAIDRAAEWARHRSELARIEAALADFPKPLAALRGGELETLDQIQADLQRALAVRDAQRRRGEQTAVEQRACRLENGPLDAALLATWRDRARTLRDDEAALARAGSDAAVASADERAAREALAGDVDLADAGGMLEALARDPAGAPPALDGEALSELDSWWAEALEVRERRTQLEAKRDAQRSGGATPTAESVDAELAELRRAVDVLRDWLATPAPPSAAPLGLAIALATGAVAGLLAGGLWHPAGYGLAAACLGGLGSAAVLAWRGRGLRAALAGLEARATALRTRPPEAWRRADVAARLQALEAELREAERGLARAEVARDAEGELQQLAPLETKLAARRTELAARFGVDPGVDGLRLADLARRLHTWREHRAAAVRTRETAEHLGRSVAGRLADLAAFVEGAGCAAPADGTAAAAELEALGERSSRWRQLETTRRDAERSYRGALEELAQLERRRLDLLRPFELDAADPAVAHRQLEAWLARLPAYREQVRERERAETAAATVREQLATHADLLELDRGSLERRRHAASQEAATESQLRDRIAAIEHQTREARGGHALEAALAAEHTAHEALETRLDEALDAEALALLLEDVESEHEVRSRPAVLSQARAWFAEFTRHRFELELDARSEPPQFRAVETASRRGLALSELSDGTRSQLWLAARLAFATVEERGTPLPLFLDEALTSSDPERFEAVAESLLSLVEAGRQVFYLTCDPADVQHWRRIAAERAAAAPGVVDLAEVRRLARGAGSAERLRPASSPQWPEPGAQSAEEYAVALGVPAPQPHAPVESLHLFHLLRDDLPELHRLLQHGRIETVGQWRSWSRAAGAPTPASSPAAAARLEARIDLAEAVLEAWRIGRGRPLTQADLAASDCVSELFLARLSSLAADLGGDARLFCSALESAEDERAKRFRRRAELRSELEAAGILDPRVPLRLDEVRARVATRLRSHLEAGHLDLAELQRQIEELWSLLETAS